MSLIYSIEVKGNLSVKNELTEKLCIPKFNSGAWMIAIPTICFQPKDSYLDGICHISTNLIKSQRYAISNQIEIHHPFIASVHFKSKKNEPNVLNLNPIWYTVTEISDYLELNFFNFETYTPFTNDMFVSVIVLFQKAK